MLLCFWVSGSHPYRNHMMNQCLATVATTATDHWGFLSMELLRGNNFKDAGVQTYGGDLFQNIRDKGRGPCEVVSCACEHVLNNGWTLKIDMWTLVCWLPVMHLVHCRHTISIHMYHCICNWSTNYTSCIISTHTTHCRMIAHSSWVITMFNPPSRSSRILCSWYDMYESWLIPVLVLTTLGFAAKLWLVPNSYWCAPWLWTLWQLLISILCSSTIGKHVRNYEPCKNLASNDGPFIMCFSKHDYSLISTVNHYWLLATIIKK